MIESFVFIPILGLWLALGCAVLSAVLAKSKRRNTGNWFLLGLLFGPLALITIAVIGEATEAPTETALPPKPKGAVAFFVIAALFVMLVYLSMTVGR